MQCAVFSAPASWSLPPWATSTRCPPHSNYRPAAPRCAAWPVQGLANVIWGLGKMGAKVTHEVRCCCLFRTEWPIWSWFAGGPARLVQTNPRCLFAASPMRAPTSFLPQHPSRVQVRHMVQLLCDEALAQLTHAQHKGALLGQGSSNWVQAEFRRLPPSCPATAGFAGAGRLASLPQVLGQAIACVSSPLSTARCKIRRHLLRPEHQQHAARAGQPGHPPLGAFETVGPARLAACVAVLACSLRAQGCRGRRCCRQWSTLHRDPSA